MQKQLKKKREYLWNIYDNIVYKVALCIFN